MKSSFKDSSLVQKLKKVCSKPKMVEKETPFTFAEVSGLDDSCIDVFNRIEKDSLSTATALPSLNEDAFRRFVKSLDDDSAVALVFLLTPDLAQASLVWASATFYWFFQM